MAAPAGKDRLISYRDPPGTTSSPCSVTRRDWIEPHRETKPRKRRYCMLRNRLFAVVSLIAVLVMVIGCAAPPAAPAPAQPAPTQAPAQPEPTKAPEAPAASVPYVGFVPPALTSPFHVAMVDGATAKIKGARLEARRPGPGLRRRLPGLRHHRRATAPEGGPGHLDQSHRHRLGRHRGQGRQREGHPDPGAQLHHPLLRGQGRFLHRL